MTAEYAESLAPEYQSHWHLFKEAMNARVDKRSISKPSARQAIYKGEKITQIVPAQGAIAKFSDDEEYKILCWCLKEESWLLDGEPETIMRVVGMILVDGIIGLQCVDSPDLVDGFIEYEYA